MTTEMGSQYTVRAKQTDEEIREYHRKRKFDLSLITLGGIPWLEEPNYEQKCWFLRRFKAPNYTWRSFSK